MNLACVSSQFDHDGTPNTSRAAEARALAFEAGIAQAVSTVLKWCDNHLAEAQTTEEGIKLFNLLVYGNPGSPDAAAIRQKEALVAAGAIKLVADACYNYRAALEGFSQPNVSREQHAGLIQNALCFFEGIGIGGGANDPDGALRRLALAKAQHAEWAVLKSVDAFPTLREKALTVLYLMSQTTPEGQATFEQFWARGGKGATKYGFTAEEAIRNGTLKLDAAGVPGKVGVLPTASTADRTAAAPPPTKKHAVSDEDWFRPGMRVVVHGLVSAPELNGRAGNVEGYNAGSGRFAVRLGASGVASAEQDAVAALQNERVVNVKGKNLSSMEMAEVWPGDDGSCQDYASLPHSHKALVRQAMQDAGADLGRLYGAESGTIEMPVCMRNGTCKLVELASAPADVVVGFEGFKSEEAVYRVPAPAGVGGFLYIAIFKGKGQIKTRITYRASAGEVERHHQYGMAPGHEEKQLPTPTDGATGAPRHVNLA